MSKPWHLVSPASRGIGLALAQRLLRTTEAPVVATGRTNLESLRSEILTGVDGEGDGSKLEERLHVLPLDVTDESTISAAASTCASLFPSNSKENRGQHHLHLSFLLPGILVPEKSPAQVDVVTALKTLQINTLGPLLLAKHFTPFLPRKSVSLPSSSSSTTESAVPVAAVMSLVAARVGSTSDNKLGGWYSYRASKAGVISLARSLDIHVRQRSGTNAMVVALHPGTVRTGLSKEFWGSTPKEKLFEAEFAAERLCEVVGSLGGLDSSDQGANTIGVDKGRGKCWDWKGEEIVP